MIQVARLLDLLTEELVPGHESSFSAWNKRVSREDALAALHAATVAVARGEADE